jgi:hypothetical protein
MTLRTALLLLALTPGSIVLDRCAVPATEQAARVTATRYGELPRIDGSVRFAVLGDTGTGGREQFEVGARLAQQRGQFPFEFAILLGDNLYGSERPQDYARKFEQPYKPLLDAGVRFYAALGNHDDPAQRLYKPFNMNGERFYTFAKGPVEFFVLDSNYMDPKQLSWLEQRLKDSGKPWRIAYFHHPLYSSGAAHGSETDLRALVEPLFVKYGVSVVFAGHEHFYERIKPQSGIAYFTAGGSAKLRRGNIRPQPFHAAGFDTDRSFMLVEIADDRMYFQVRSRTGEIVDGGVVERRNTESADDDPLATPSSSRRQQQYF